MLRAGTETFPPRQHPAASIHRELVTRHGADGISYHMVRAYVGRRRATMQRASLSPAHQAVADHDLARLRELLDDGHDMEDDNGDGWTLLRHAISTEADGHIQVGRPLQISLAAFLLARGADPCRPGPGKDMTIAEEAAACGHWLAAEIIRFSSRSQPGG